MRDGGEPGGPPCVQGGRAAMSIAGAILVTAAGLLAGLLAADRLRACARRREGLCHMLSLIEFELSRFRTPLPALFAGLSQTLSGACGALCRQVAEGLAEPEGRSFSDVWAAETARLAPREREILGPLGQVLGRYGAEEQLAAVGLCRRDMERALEEARAAVGEKGRIYIGLSTAGGLMLAVLLM